MVNHFPNFVCWEEVFRDYDNNRDIIFLDSISCFLLGLLLGVKGNYFSGPKMAYMLEENSFENCYFLLSEEIETIDKNKKIVLPFKSSFKGDKDVLNFLNLIPSGGFVITGVSSPKQNDLANYLYSIRPDLEYFCLGAAVKQTWGFKYANTRLRGSGFQWIEFLVLQPRRTVDKLKKTLIGAFEVLLSWKRIKKFRKFVLVTGLRKSC